MNGITYYQREDGGITVAATVQDGRSCGPYIAEGTYYGMSEGGAA